MAILKIEVWWKKYITSLQIIQFVLDISAFGLSAVWNKYWVKETVCSSWHVWWHNYVASSIVASYLVLFIQFYIEAYLSGRNKKAAAGASKPADKAKKTN
jgi:fatty acid elongase 3